MNKIWKKFNSIFLIAIFMISLVPLAFATSTSPVSPFDTNNDGDLDLDDWDFCSEFYTTQVYNDRCDFNDDDIINAQDMAILLAAIGESDELPDLIVEDISFSPSNPEEDDNVYVTVIIKNQGDATASNFWVGLYEFYGAEQVSSSDADKAETSKTVSGYTLAPGESMKKSFGPYKFTSGSHTMMAWADMFNSVEESEEDNNVRYETVSVDEAPSNDVIFKDYFNSNTLSSIWLNYQGLNPTIVDNELDLPYFGEAGHNMRIVDMEPGTDNYAVTAKMQIVPEDYYDSGDTRVTTLVARFQDTETFYKAGINERNNAFIMEKHVNGVKSTPDFTYNKGSMPVEQGEWYDVRFEVSGNTLRLYVDGELIKEAIDSDISSGKFGLRNGEAHSKVHDFVVYRLDDITPPQTGDFSVSIDTDKETYEKGDLARITVKVKGENVNVDQTELNVEVVDGYSSQAYPRHDIPMTRGVCTSSNSEITYCNWEGYWDTSLSKEYNGASAYYAKVTAELNDNIKSNSALFSVRSDVVESTDLVEVTITPKDQKVEPGDSVTYDVIIKDNHPSTSNSNSNTYKYNLVVSGLPYKDSLPNSVTLLAGEERVLEMNVYTTSILEDEIEEVCVGTKNKITPSETSRVCCDDLVKRPTTRSYGSDCSLLSTDDSAFAYACLECGDGKCDTVYENECNCPEDCEHGTYECFDNDGGLSYYTSSWISGDAPEDFLMYDRCLSSTTLRETYCDENDENGDEHEGTAKLYACSYGCEDGACLRKSEADEYENSVTGNAVTTSIGTAVGGSSGKAVKVQEATLYRIGTSAVEVEEEVVGEVAITESSTGERIDDIKLMRFQKKQVISNRYHGKTYYFTVKATLQGQGNVKDSASASIFVGEDNSEIPPQEIPEFPTETYVIGLEKGWNLISMPGMFVKFDSQGCSDNRKLLGFVYLKEEQKYVTLSQAEDELGANFRKYLSENAVWIYSFSDCELNVNIIKQTNYEDIDLVKGWNLVTITEDMVGESLSSIGDCDYEKLYFWDANNQEWNSFSENYVFDNSDVTKGFITKVDQACTLGTAILAPPSMPDD